MSDQTGKKKQKISGLIGFAYFLLTLGILFLDQSVKSAVSHRFSPGEGIAVIKNIFHITLVHNTGIAFGMLRDKNRLSFVFFITGIILLLTVLFFKKGSCSSKERFALVLVIAGALSNLSDRIRFGFVVDYLDFKVWPVFNIADVAITIGIILIIRELFIEGRSSANNKKQIS